MSIPLTINGAVFEYPVNLDEDWGVDATGWAQAVTNGMLQMAGGTFPLTADVNFGPNFGLLSKYFETRSSNPATTGTVRLSSADAGIVFRNNANSGNLVLTTDALDSLTYPAGLKLSGTLLLHNDNAMGFQDTGNAHTILMLAPTVATNYSLVLPPDTGSNGQVLSTDGTGATSWINAAGGGTVNSGTSTHLAYYATTGATIDELPDIFYNPSQLRIVPPGGTTQASIYLLSAGVGGPSAYQMETNGEIISMEGRNDGTFHIIDVSNSNLEILAYNSPFSSPFISTALPLNMTSHKITNVTNPTAAQDVATKNYVDTRVAHVQMGTLSGQASTINGVFTNTGLAVTITPQFSTSKIMIVASGAGSHTSGAGHVSFSLARGVTNLGGSFPAGLSTINVGSSGGSSPTTNFFIPLSLSYLDSPATTSPVTYNLTFGGNGVGTVYFGYAGSISTIIAYEILQ